MSTLTPTLPGGEGPEADRVPGVTVAAPLGATSAGGAVRTQARDFA